MRFGLRLRLELRVGVGVWVGGVGSRYDDILVPRVMVEHKNLSGGRRWGCGWRWGKRWG